MDVLVLAWKPITEIVVLWYILYIFLLFLRGTRAFHVLKGLVLLAILYLITKKLDLYVINWLLTKLFALSVIGFLVIFHPELRRGLAQIGQNKIFELFAKEEEIIDELVKAVVSMSQRKIGAIIAIGRQVSLLSYVESGVALDCKVSSEVVRSIFIPNGPLHDGGVVISDNRIQAAGCLFPLSESPNVSKIMGTRHRAAIGLTEETDAAVIVVSEETGAISVAINGKLTRDLDRDSLGRILRNLFRNESGHKKRSKFWQWGGNKGQKIG
ncbi:MAG: diadenylate cyclase CdaA [Candidatus Omnitrophota bacterium]